MTKPTFWPTAIAAAALISSAGWLSAMSESEFETTTQDIMRLQKDGELNRASDLAEEALARESLSAEQRRAFEWEIERASRIRRDYWLTEDRLLEVLGERFDGFTHDEYQEWLAEGRFDTRMIDGQRRFVGPSVANLLFRHPELRHRDSREYSGNWERFLFGAYEKLRDQADSLNPDVFPPEKFEVTFTITVREDQVEEGETIRVWMPLPQQFKGQGNVRIHSAEPEPKWINAPDYPQRSIYFEAPSNGTEPTVFTATYSFETHPRWANVDPDRVVPSSSDNLPEYDYFTGEQEPHVIFTPRIRELVEEIVGEEPNPYLRARAIYDWMSDNVQYSYAREYSTLRNISDYVCDTMYGDCGQLALLYITLCRAAGVPARWQSGWTMYPASPGLHDWAEIHIAPYGWIPVDVNYGIFATQRMFGLEEAERLALRDYYFGGLDAFRMTVNRDHGFPHFPAKEDFRSDTVDFQRGEVEAGGKNLYYGQFRYRVTLKYGEEERDGAAMQGGAGSS